MFHARFRLWLSHMYWLGKHLACRLRKIPVPAASPASPETIPMTQTPNPQGQPQDEPIPPNQSEIPTPEGDPQIDPNPQNPPQIDPVNPNKPNQM